jgi:regulator of sigma E protease
VTYVIAIGGLLLLVLVHELGHFVAAKATGMRALKFYVGFPPAILRKKIGDTEYGIGAIPLGGFVKIPGMLRPEASDLWAVAELLEKNEKLPPELATDIGIKHDDISRLLGQGRSDDARAELQHLRRLLEEAEPSMSDVERRRTRKCLDRLEESLDPRAYWRSSKRSRLIVIAAGPLTNIVATFLILTGLAVTGLPQPVRAIPKVAGLEQNMPAAQAGLKVGDRIVSINGTPIKTFDQARQAISGSNGRPLRIVVRRDGKTIELPPITPVKSGGRYIIGFIPDGEVHTKSFPVWKAPVEGAAQMWSMLSGTFSGLKQQGTSSLSGPVGIVRVSATVADTGAPYYLWLLAYISLSLGILNLFPFLPLDGGHILMLAVERIRGRAVSRATFERVSAFGIALVLILFLFGLHNDLLNPQPR